MKLPLFTIVNTLFCTHAKTSYLGRLIYQGPILVTHQRPVRPWIAVRLMNKSRGQGNDQHCVFRAVHDSRSEVKASVPGLPLYEAVNKSTHNESCAINRAKGRAKFSSKCPRSLAASRVYSPKRISLLQPYCINSPLPCPLIDHIPTVIRDLSSRSPCQTTSAFPCMRAQFPKTTMMLPVVRLTLRTPTSPAVRKVITA